MSVIYPSGDHQITPNLGLGLWGVDEVVADNWILIDAAFGTVGGSIKVNGSVVNSPNFVNSASVTFSVVGSNISLTASGGGAWATLTGDLTQSQVIPWDGAVVGIPDTGISRLSSGTIAIGNGTAGDFSGSLKLTSINLVGTFKDSTGSVGTSGQVLSSIVTGTQWTAAATGTVTSFSAGTLSPLFTTSVATPTTTPALTFSLSNAGGGTIFGNNTTGSASPAYTTAPVLGIPGTSTGTIALASSTASGMFIITAPANAATPTLTLPTTSNVLAGQLAGDGTVFSSSLVTASSAGTLTLPTPSNQTANTVFAGPTSGGAAAPTFRALVNADIPSGTVLWNNIGNASGNLTLANAGFTTEFDQTSAVAWLWKNATVATVSTTNASPTLNLAANYWTGAASAADTWTLASTLGAGTNGTTSLALTHSGSISAAQFLFNLGSGNSVILGSTAAANNLTGTLWALNVLIGDGVSTLPISMRGANKALQLASAAYIRFSSTTAENGTADLSLSRSAAGVLAIGSGAQGSSAGNLSLATITNYGGVATVASGVPAEYATLNLTGQAASIGSTTLYAVPASGAGMYRINYYLDVSTAGVGGTLTVTFGWTDVNSSESITSASVSLGGVTGDFTQGVITFYSKASVNITYLTTFTVGTGSPQYELRTRLEYLG